MTNISSPWQTAVQEYDCEHTDVKLTRRPDSMGRIHVWKQCQRCGYSLGAVGKTGLDIDSLPEWDESLRQSWEDRRRQRANELREEAAAAANVKQTDFWNQYDDYRQSDHWKALRRRVIARDHFQCQNCFCRVTEGSAHVHHISYQGLKDVGHSFAFECVTLCRSCHIDYHPHMQDEPSQVWQVTA